MNNAAGITRSIVVNLNIPDQSEIIINQLLWMAVLRNYQPLHLPVQA
jgi:hypothetical protein